MKITTFRMSVKFAQVPETEGGGCRNLPRRAAGAAVVAAKAAPAFKKSRRVTIRRVIRKSSRANGPKKWELKQQRVHDEFRLRAASRRTVGFLSLVVN